jgi:hypothetical protein
VATKPTTQTTQRKRTSKAAKRPRAKKRDQYTTVATWASMVLGVADRLYGDCHRMLRAFKANPNHPLRDYIDEGQLSYLADALSNASGYAMGIQPMPPCVLPIPDPLEGFDD